VVRAELAVLHEQDAAYVEDLIKEIEKQMKKYEEARADSN
jgi:hypothetical protein